MIREDKFNDYESFIEKFKPKKTTDDCYTPPEVYEVIKNYVFDYYKLDKDIEVIRPFYPGGDYKNFEYPENSIVIDNPPFSILKEIKDFYCKNNIKFFLFAPHLTVFRRNDHESICYVIADYKITYENGAIVNTSFVTNIDDCRIRLEPRLRRLIAKCRADNRPKKVNYKYPDNVISAALLGKYLNCGCEMKFYNHELHFTRCLDEQRKFKKVIYGTGYLISDKKVKELKEFKEFKEFKEPDNTIYWALSDKEEEIIRNLD